MKTNKNTDIRKKLLRAVLMRWTFNEGSLIGWIINTLSAFKYFFQAENSQQW